MSKEDEIYEAVTIQTLRIIEKMRFCQCDADIIQQEFIGEISDYERRLARRENITLK